MADDQDEKKQQLAIAGPNPVPRPNTVSPIASPNSTFAATMGAPAAAPASVVPRPAVIAAPTSTPQPTGIAAPAAPTVSSPVAAPSMGIPESPIPAFPPPTIQSGGARLWQAAGNVQNPVERGPGAHRCGNRPGG